MNVLVTGCAGFIGYHLTQSLLKRNYQVIGLDNLSTGIAENMAILNTNPNFHFVSADVTQKLPHLPKLSRIYNFACPASPPHYQKDPIQTWKTSVLGAMNVLELARSQSCPVLQASTSEVYGDPQQHPQREDYVGHVNPIGTRACYDEGKRAAESLFFDYHRQHGVRIKIIRIFNTYGPHMHPRDGRVVSNFITQAINHQPITIYGDGTQTRSFCYIDDLIAGIHAVMDAPAEITGPINLGNPAESTVLQLADKIRAMTGSSSEIVHRPKPADDPSQRRPDIGLAGRLLGWEPAIPLDQGLEKTIAYFRNLGNRDAPSAGKLAHG